MSTRDRLVNEACLRSELVHAPTVASNALEHPERPARSFWGTGPRTPENERLLAMAEGFAADWRRWH